MQNNSIDKTVIDKTVIDKITECFMTYKDVPGLEIEFRLGYIEDGSFNSNISKEFYDIIHNELSNSSVFQKKNIESIDTYYGKNHIRHSTIDNSYVQKTRLHNLNISYEPFDIRVSFSKEEPVKTKPRSKPVYTRNKNRNSYNYKFWSYDLTKITTNENSLDIVNYEIELEIKKDLSNADNEFIQYIIESSLMKLTDLSKICENDSNATFIIN
jgi:hypothetical protein